ncbi:hypothetical protein GCM10010172_50760 [Paractinoplanes ferrugineus]|uniref:ABC transporter permease n=1 Tax=Paractinoplanes ferrugineus TaxID=113564 RepID=A0A919J766_9ACTN|nr:hypothetical protein [Actinoplanes ferrugineus]GIE16106.1 hypothetical protein Afe05nite_79460 [Actinoplanes ferrugineus]
MTARRHRLRRATTAELIKLRGLPAALAAMLATVVAGALFAAADPAGPAQAVPFLQIGPIVLGVLVVAAEYSGRQIATTLIAMPRRLVLLAGKAGAYLIAATATSVITIGGWLVPGRPAGRWTVIGAAAYLVLMGLLALGLTVLLRSLVLPLAGLLTLVLVVSPLLAGYTEHARWLPDQAGRALSQPHGDFTTGAAILLAWTASVAAAGTVAFLSRDA